jgi:hypothetical protein
VTHGTLELLGAALIGLLLGRLSSLARRRLLLDTLYGLVFAGWGADAASVHYHLRARPWSASLVSSALAELERMGLADGWDGDPFRPGVRELRRYASKCSPPPSTMGSQSGRGT